MKYPKFRLFDFEVLNKINEVSSNYNFLIKMFAMDSKGKTYCIFVKNFNPFFYVKVPDNWIKGKDDVAFKLWLGRALGHSALNNAADEHDFVQRRDAQFAAEAHDYFNNGIISCNIVKRKDLYGFDNGKEYNFLKIEFDNTTIFNEVKKLWYTDVKNFRKRTLLKKGLLYGGSETEIYLKIYEAVLPPLLRYFHIMDISPSGWATFHHHVKKTPSKKKETHCDYEYITTYENIKPLVNKEDAVPMKIMSFDIEASSSHGDFPVARKTYKKMLGEIIQYWTQHKKEIRKMASFEQKTLFTELIYTAFGYIPKSCGKSYDGISKVYVKKNEKILKDKLSWKISRITNEESIGTLVYTRPPPENDRKRRWERLKWERMDEEEKANYRDRNIYIPKCIKKKNVLEFLNMKYDAGKKLEILDKAFEYDKNKIEKVVSILLPRLEGDKCTFIGSTFLKLGDKESYYNNMIVLGKCADTPEVPNSEIISCEKERDLLLEWAKLIKKEDPDIIIGYNIFGFDWKFMIDRAKELKCEYEFLKLNRNKKDKCEIVESSTTVASGSYELIYPKIAGRLQIDLYNYFRKSENLPSYKLDYVSSYFIGDIVTKYEVKKDITIIKSKNLMGLKNGHYICFEILGHSSDKYNNGKKFKINNLDIDRGTFEINYKLEIDKKTKFRWCLGKDDVTPQDIFRLSNEGPMSKAIVAKYCFQDCNLVHDLFIKNDIFTAMVEQAKICSVPIDFISRRGQGIKLLSFIAKKCAHRNTVMPVVRKDKSNEGYEGAICLEPKAGLYVDDPVAVVDYAALYPSSMISENLSHDSKVWTKEYDLEGNLIKVTGEHNGKCFIYDNLPGFKYVNVAYDTYKYVKKTPKSAAVKIISGKKICRFAQFPNNEKAIMPSVLQELLVSRKSTRKLIKYKTVTTKTGKKYSGILTNENNIYVVVNDKEKFKIQKSDIDNVEDTYNNFMKNVFDKRQLSYKIVANSLYGQCGGKTSSFYDKDIAASTTAVGRKLLLYGKRVIEECYNDTIVETSYGVVRVNSEYIYGDTDSIFFKFNLKEEDGKKIIGEKALKITIELAIKVGKLASKFLKEPHDLEYEKTFMPLLLLSKKRYVGKLYEYDINKCKMKSMGIVLKRRDNAACVKDCYGQVVDILMSGKSADSAASSVINYINNMVNEKIKLEKLIITKSLNGFYKNPDSIAHKVLADRMAKRDPGNKPAVGSRIPYIYIQTKKSIKLQGDRIEHPSYIKTKKLKPDYAFYISNQIMKPVTQIFSLILNNLTKFKNTNMKLNYNRKLIILKNKYKNDKLKLKKKIIDLKDSMVKDIIFSDALRHSLNKKNKQYTIQDFFC